MNVCRMPWFPFSYWKTKKDEGVNAVLLGPPASGKGTQVQIGMTNNRNGPENDHNGFENFEYNGPLGSY